MITQKLKLTSDYGFEYLKDNTWHNDKIVAKGGEETLVIDNLTGKKLDMVIM